MAETAPRPADWQSILAVPDGVKAEVLGGELITSPRPLASHGLLQVTLSATLEPPFYRVGELSPPAE